MTAKDELIQLIISFDESQINKLSDVLLCATTYGEDFWKEAQAYLDRNDSAGLKAMVAKRAAIAKEAKPA